MEKEIQNLFILECLDEENLLPYHFFECLNGTTGKVDIETKKQLKSALKDVCFDELFNEKNYILKGSKHVLLDTDNLTINQKHSVFTKNSSENCRFLNFFSSDIDDISLTSTWDQIERISDALVSVKNRAEQQVKDGIINSAMLVDEVDADFFKLGKYLHWQICEEYSLRSKPDRSRFSPMITGAVLLKAFLLTDLSQCTGSCGKIYSSTEENPNILCECGGEIILVPPMLKIENISFVVPKNIEEMVQDSEESSPFKIFSLINRAFLDRKLTLTLNKLTSFKMGNKIAIPASAYYQYKDTNDILRVNFIHEIKDEREIVIFACIMMKTSFLVFHYQS